MLKFHRKNVPLTLLFVGLLSFGGLFIFSSKGREEASSAKKRIKIDDIVKSSQDQMLEKFSLTGFDEKGKKSWKLEGEAAKVDPGQTVFLDQNVTLKLKDTTTIRTDHVQWSQDGGRLKTDSLVTVDHENAKIKGMGAHGILKDNFIQLNRNIEMVLNDSTRLTCSGPLKMFYKENRMIFYRKVKITDERGVLTSNRMDVLFDPEAKKVKQIIAVGNVVIVRGTDTTHSERAIYTVATGSIRLEGNPEITLHKESTKLLDATLRN